MYRRLHSVHRKPNKGRRVFSFKATLKSSLSFRLCQEVLLSTVQSRVMPRPFARILKLCFSVTLFSQTFRPAVLSQQKHDPLKTDVRQRSWQFILMLAHLCPHTVSSVYLYGELPNTLSRSQLYTDSNETAESFLSGRCLRKNTQIET
jgi:hypothetical protein